MRGGSIGALMIGGIHMFGANKNDLDRFVKNCDSLSRGSEMDRALRRALGTLAGPRGRVDRVLREARVALGHRPHRRLLGNLQGARQPRAPHPRRPQRAGHLKPLRSLTGPPYRWDNGAKRALPVESKRNFFDSAGIMEHVDPIFYGHANTAAMEVLGG